MGAAGKAAILERCKSSYRQLPESDAPKPLFLTLKGESFTLFTKLVERLAAKAKWDLPLAISRMGDVVTAKKGILH